jgi:polar amino acid transport system substrate-binding protein
MPKGSAIAGCVGRAVTQLQANGTLAALDKQWIASGSKVPVLH